MQIYSGPYEVEHQSGEVRKLEVTGLGIFDRDKQLPVFASFSLTLARESY